MKVILPAPIVMIFSLCVQIRSQAEHICERSEAEMKVRPQAEPESKRAKRVCSFHYVIKSSRPEAEQCKRAKRVCPSKESAHRHRGRRPRCLPCERSEQWGWHAKRAGVSPRLYNIKLQESLTDSLT